jgi:hypothetical protein
MLAVVVEVALRQEQELQVQAGVALEVVQLDLPVLQIQVAAEVLAVLVLKAAQVVLE